MLTRYYAIGLVNTNTSLIQSTALLNGGTHGFAAYHTAYSLLFKRTQVGPPDYTASTEDHWK